ncbi:Release factor glutamine methyltransferase [Fermentimonas caenicola]|jgi:release factor glutamine methyltransferase|uniref:Release factor glutamine methyltransferase n=1 Tax=Fermentimonas caenicola TaxID=1562970 RepID=A0A098C1H5_9BACT|nr:Release factor glutamine methyltransferase [Fermentimonas caenicola]
MQELTHYIRQELGSLYTHTELFALIRIILEEVTGIDNTGIISDKFNHLSSSELSKIKDIIGRLKKSEPIQYVLGKTEFYGLNFKVSPDVLIPRPETEELVEWILSEKAAGPVSILDIGTGSGCIAVTLAKKLPQAEVNAWDISEGALDIARENARINNVTVNFSNQDVLSINEDNEIISEGGKYDVIISNPPYVMDSEKKSMDDNVLNYEPHVALFVEDDNPLLFYDKISTIALDLLNDNGKLYFEINRDKGDDILHLLKSKGYDQIELRRDISGNFRMIKGVRTVSGSKQTYNHE